jgi:hypothetical protein
LCCGGEKVGKSTKSSSNEIKRVVRIDFLRAADLSGVVGAVVGLDLDFGMFATC